MVTFKDGSALIKSVEVDKIDAFDGTPVIDLKPYIPAFDRVGVARTPAWVPTR